MINLKKTYFSHHRDGWNSATKELIKIHDANGIMFFDWADWELKFKVKFDFKWSGILHNVLNYPIDDYPRKYGEKRLLSLTSLVKDESFKNNMKNCKGLFTLCKYTCDFLKTNVDVPVDWIWHPIDEVDKKFDFSLFEQDPKIYMIGQWLRKFHSFFELRTSIKKMMPKISGFEEDYIDAINYSVPKDVNMINYMSNQDYDNALSSSIVFIDLYDAAACNTVIECIIRNTPLLVNPLPAVVQYLGEDYPFYFNSLEEASEKSVNFELIKETSCYLQKSDKEKFRSEKFLESFVNSKVYKKIVVRIFN